MPDVPKDVYRILRDNFPLICTDGVVVFEKKILLVRRNIEPFKGYWTLPGGHVDYGETLEEAVRREVFEETQIEAMVRGLIGIFANPKRDPWGHIISIAFLLSPEELFAADASGSKGEALSAKWCSISELPIETGFDHKDMILAAQDKYPNFF